MSSTFSTSLTIAQVGNNGPAVVRYRNGAADVAYVVNVAGRIRDFMTVHHLCWTLGIALGNHGAQYPSSVPSTEHLAKIVEELVEAGSLKLGNLAALVMENEVSAGWQLESGWNDPGWLVEYDPALHGGIV